MASAFIEPGFLTPSTQRLTSVDGTQLFVRHLEHAAPRARIVLVHGYSDHGGRYEHVMALLGSRGFSVSAPDLRGHGASAGRRGHIRNFAQYVDDLETTLQHLGSTGAEPLPLFLVGHSLGGLVAAYHTRNRPGRVAGLVLAAPFIELRFEVPAWKRALAGLLSGAWPGFSLPSGMPAELLSHDPQWLERYESDPLVFRRATARWFTETTAAQVRVLSGVSAAPVPLLLLLAGDDRVVCNAAARRLHATMGAGSADVMEYPGLYHDLFHEFEHARVVSDIVRWTDRQLQERPCVEASTGR